jgi:glycosyltransferase involved in cell wall biosynthesis
MVKFQILIPTMPGREVMLLRLVKVLEPQIARHRGASYFIDAGEGSIGVKRQRMIEKSTADYIAFVDDDDMVSADYLDRIMPCLASKPDCVGVTMHVTMDGKDLHPSPIFRHSLRYKENYQWRGQDRTPHHLCPLRRTIALQSRFPDLMWGEDFRFAMGLLQHLKTEEWASDEPLYFYNYVSKKGDPTFDSGKRA